MGGLSHSVAASIAARAADVIAPAAKVKLARAANFAVRDQFWLVSQR
jgi:hypothetical protein